VPVPTYDKFIEPILRFLAAHADGAPARDAYEAAASALGLSDSDRDEMLPSGAQAIYKNRAGWAHDRLKRAGFSISPRRGFWQLTESGVALAKKHRGKLPEDLVQDIATGHAESSLSQFFETIVLDVLHKMGYGTSRSDIQRVGRSGDGGIDGVISLDRLGLEKVYVQAKRWQNSVGRPEVQAFYGALAGQRANKGVFITTSTPLMHARRTSFAFGHLGLFFVAQADGQQSFLTSLAKHMGTASELNPSSIAAITNAVMSCHPFRGQALSANCGAAFSDIDSPANRRPVTV
jgi:restriction system protein